MRKFRRMLLGEKLWWDHWDQGNPSSSCGHFYRFWVKDISEWKTFGTVSGAVPAEAQCAAVVPQERRELKMIAFNSVLIILNNKSLNSHFFLKLNSWKEDHFVAQVTMTVAPASRAWRKPSWASPDKSTWASTWVPAKIQDELRMNCYELRTNHDESPKVFLCIFSISDEKPIHIFLCVGHSLQKYLVMDIMGCNGIYIYI